MASVRAQNWLNGLDRLDAARRAGAALFPVCPANDVAAGEVADELAARRLAVEAVSGTLCVRLASGETFPPEPESEDEKQARFAREMKAAEAGIKEVLRNLPALRTLPGWK